MTRARSKRLFCKQSGSRQGFTLAEVLVALTILSIAISIGVSLFFRSMGLAHEARSTRVATDIAQEQILEIRNHLQQYQWPDFDTLDPSAAHVLALKGQEDKIEVLFLAGPPSVMPVDRRNQEAETAFHEQFSGNAYVIKPEDRQGFCELIVVVRWLDGGRSKRIALTTSIPLSVIKEAS